MILYITAVILIGHGKFTNILQGHLEINFLVKWLCTNVMTTHDYLPKMLCNLCNVYKSYFNNLMFLLMFLHL